MVFHSSSGPASSRAAGGASQQDAHQHQAGVIQAPLKRKRSLSKFYFAKSQSFNCMSDVLKSSAFSKSSLLLAKRSSSSSSSGGGYTHSFPSILEDMSECTSPRGPCPEASTAAVAIALAAAVPAPLQPSPFAAAHSSSLQRHSWDASDCSTSEPFCSMGCYSVAAALDHNCCCHLQQQQQQQQQQLAVVSSLTSRSGSSSLELEAADDSGAACWPEAACSATDSLCMALQTTSLAAATAPQGLLPVAGGSYHGCYMVEV
jgi:hypothetical protein